LEINKAFQAALKEITDLHKKINLALDESDLQNDLQNDLDDAAPGEEIEVIIKFRELQKITALVSRVKSIKNDDVVLAS